MKTALCALALLCLSATSALATPKTVVWKAGGGYCHEVCNAAEMVPLSSGKYSNGNYFYVCRDEKGRPGYNLQPQWSAVCVVGEGGAERAKKQYSCACLAG